MDQENLNTMPTDKSKEQLELEEERDKIERVLSVLVVKDGEEPKSDTEILEARDMAMELLVNRSNAIARTIDEKFMPSDDGAEL